MEQGDPFPDLVIPPDQFEALDSSGSKVPCTQCNRKRLFYCYNCLCYVNGLEKKINNIKLPCKIDIIKHPAELDSKSTALHALLVAPEDVRMFIFPDIPTYNPGTDVLIFPTKDCMTVENWAQKLSSQCEDHSEVEFNGRVIFIDCTWNQIHPIINCPQVQGLPKIELKQYKTKFWRPNGAKLTDECLATIEAIYYFLREFHEHFIRTEYTGQYDQTMLFFKALYIRIREYHKDSGKLPKAYWS